MVSRRTAPGDDEIVLRSLVDELSSLVSIPNVTGDLDMARRNAAEIVRRFEAHGVAAELIQAAGGSPYVIGRRKCSTPDAPTLLFYCHYDGVPVEPSEWSTDPWTPTLCALSDGRLSPAREGDPIDASWRLVGRSAADAKAAIVAMLAGLRALSDEGTEPSVNLEFLIDGEEEHESPSLATFLDEHGDSFRADLLIAAEGPLHQSGRSTVDLGVRGLLIIEIVVYTAAVALHSGHFGNWGRNAALELARLLASLKRADGTVAIDGFDEGIIPLSDEERQYIAEIPPVEDDLSRQFGVGRPESAGTLQELINSPTMNIRGIRAGAVGHDASNVVPHRAEASLDSRLVAGMDPEVAYRRFVEHVERLGMHVVESPPDARQLSTYGTCAQVTRVAGFPAVRTSASHPLARRVISAVESIAAGGLVIQPTEGGSVQFCRFVSRGIPFIGVPTFNSDSNQHTADENVRLGNLLLARDTFKALFTMDVSGLDAKTPAITK